MDTRVWVTSKNVESRYRTKQASPLPAPLVCFRSVPCLALLTSTPLVDGAVSCVPPAAGWLCGWLGESA
jgi:hypothetical protein